MGALLMAIREHLRTSETGDASYRVPTFEELVHGTTDATRSDEEEEDSDKDDEEPLMARYLRIHTQKKE